MFKPGKIPTHPGRGGRSWQAARKACLKHATHCAICGGELDFNAKPRSRYAPSVDHRIPLKAMRGLSALEQRRLSLDPENLRPAHYGCNSRRGAGGGAPGRVSAATAVRDHSRQW